MGSLQDNHSPCKASCEQPSSRQQGANVSKPDDGASSQQDDVLPQQQSDTMVASSHDDTTETPAAQNVMSEASLSSSHHDDDDSAMELSTPESCKTSSLDIVKEFQGVLHNEV